MIFHKRTKVDVDWEVEVDLSQRQMKESQKDYS